MTGRRSLGIGFTLALALAVAACGGAAVNGHPGAAGTDGHGAEAFPPSTIAFVDASTEMSSTGWMNVRTALGRIPGWAKVEAELVAAMDKPPSGDKSTYSKDVKPWLGKEIAGGLIGLTMAGGSPKPEAVLYVESSDDGAAEKFLGMTGKRGGDYKGYHEYALKGGSGIGAVGNGALLVATDMHSMETSIDAREGGARLQDQDVYKATLAKLPSDGVVVAYLQPSALAPILSTIMAAASSGMAGATTALPASSLGSVTDALKSYVGIGMSFYGDANGVGLLAVVNRDPAHPAKVVSPPVTLIDHAPASAVAFVDESLAGLGSGLDTLKQNPMYSGMLLKLEQATGLSLVGDILPLLTGEVAVVVNGGAPVGGSLLLRPKDLAAGAMSMRKITAAVTKLRPDVAFSPLGSGDGQQASIGGAMLTWAKGADVLAVGYDTGGTVPGPGLATSAHYARTSADAHVGKDPTAVVWVDPSGIAGLPGVPAAAGATLGALDGFLFWTAGDSGGLYVDIPPAG